MKLLIRNRTGHHGEWHCDAYRREGDWLILYDDEIISEVAPIPKRKEVAFFHSPATIRVIEDADDKNHQDN